MKFPVKILFLLPIILSACQSQNNSQNQDYVMSENQRPFAYDLGNPSSKYTLPHNLEEISGLSYLGNSQLACVQDEKGFVFIFDETTQNVVEKYKFGKNGDYEGVEIVGNTTYAVRNDGTIYEIQFKGDEKTHVEKYSTFLNEKDNIEGLGFDKETNQLLLACKGNTDKKTRKSKREVYAFNLETKILQEEPFLIFNLEDIANFTGEEEIEFNTSGIAIHPLTGEIYMIASAGKKLIITKRDGFILDVQALDRDVFKQPEGICFDTKGTLFISNEGRGGKANILKFEYLKN